MLPLEPRHPQACVGRAGMRPARAQPPASMRLRGGFLLVFLEAAFLDDLENVAVGGADLERIGVGLGQDGAAALLDDFGRCLAIGDLYAPVMDAGTGSGEL